MDIRQFLADFAEKNLMSNASYGDFAYLYDMLTDDVEYTQRADYIEKIINLFLGRKPELLCDLGCGTGTICSILTKRGYDCIGIDSSDTMLSIATDKNTDGNILFLNQDITDFELYGTVDVFTCMLDTVNYITDVPELKNMFALVVNYLNPNGLFIFDVNTQYKFENVLGNNTIVYEKDDIFYTWENFYQDGELEFYLNFFVKQKNGEYKRISEEHFQRYYSIEQLTDIAQSCGLTPCGVYGDMTTEAPLKNEERVFMIFKKV